MMPQLEVQPVGPLWAEILLAGLSLAALGYCWYSTRYQSLGIRAAVVSIRALLLGFGLLLLHQPTFTSVVKKERERKLAVLVDRSGSMGAQAQAGSTRYEQAFAVARNLQDGGVPVDILEFDQTLGEPVDTMTGTRKISGDKTDYYPVINQLLTRSDDYSSVLLLSDGHDLGRFGSLSDDELGRWLARLQAPPINTALIGDQPSGPEVSIHSIDAPSFSFVRAPLRITVTILVRNLDQFKSQVQLLENDEIVQIRDLELDDQGFGTVDFEFYPEELGEHLFTIHVPPHHLENNTENNSRRVLVDIGRDKISVLHIAGSITWDLQGLRDMFERNDLVDLTAFYIMRTRFHQTVGTDNRNIPPEEMALVPFPTDEIFDRQLFGFDVVVFHDFDAGTYVSDSYQTRRLMSKIREFVTSHHGGFVVVGGPRMAGGPSLALTPLNDVLPIVPPVYRTPYDSAAKLPVPTDLGRSHPLLRQFDFENFNFAGTMGGVTLNKNADVLLQTKGGDPLLATLNTKTGRALFLNTSSSWEWRRDAINRGKTGEAYYDFWSQVFKWVTRDPSLHQVRLSATKNVTHPLQVDVDLLARKRNFEAAENENVTLRLVSLADEAENQELQVQTDGAGKAATEFAVAKPGYYRLEAVESPWRELSKPVVMFLGGSQDELRNLDIVPETLQRLASLTGGNFMPASDTIKLSDLAWGETPGEQIVEARRLKLRHWIWTLPIIILLAAVEWVLRRTTHLA